MKKSGEYITQVTAINRGRRYIVSGLARDIYLLQDRPGVDEAKTLLADFPLGEGGVDD